MRIKDMKYILTVILCMFFVMPALSQEAPKNVTPVAKNKEDVFSPSTISVDLTKHYRYTNKKCDFSFQVPEAPTSKILWGEMTLPMKIKDMPTYGEAGEHLIYHVMSNDKSTYFKLDAYCLYNREADYSSIDLAAMETKLQSLVEEQGLRNYKIKTEPISQDFMVGTLYGLKIDDNEKVNSHYYQYFKGKDSILMLEMKYNSEQMGIDLIQKYIKDSLIYGGN